MGSSHSHLRSRVTAGLFVLLPILFTFLILQFAFNFVDGILNPHVEQIFDRSIPGLGKAGKVPGAAHFLHEVYWKGF